MKNGFRTAALSSLALAALACAGPAAAQAYWRLDTGYSKSRDAEIKDKGPSQLTCGNAACTTGATFDDVQHSMIFGLGWGYRFGKYFRSDITFSSRDDYHLNAADKSIPASTVNANVKSKAIMLNLYYDFPSSTPNRFFIGIGGGASQNRVGEITGTNFQGPDSPFSAPGGTKTSAAGAIMGGISVPMDTAQVEFGFRFLSLGKFETASGDLTVTSGGMTTVSTYDGLTGRLRVFEWTVGVRF